MSHKKTDGDQATLLSVQGDAVVNEKIEDVGNNSTLGTFVLTLKSYIGSGILGLPFAFLQGKPCARSIPTLQVGFGLV